MILIVGGRAQDKRHFAESCIKAREQSPDAKRAEDIPESHPQIMGELQTAVRQWLAELPETEKEEEAASLARKFRATVLKDVSRDGILICEEIGLGIVPADREERLWRDVTGRLCCLLAEESEEVYRLWCGLPQRLK